jgi:integrase/recombinase XerD
MSVYLRNNRWIVDYRPDGRYGKRIRMPLPEAIVTEEEAKAIERELKAAAQGERVAQIGSPNLTLEDLFYEYLDWYEMHRAKTTYRDLRYIYEASLKRLLGDVKVVELNSHHILVYERIRKGEKVSNRTIMKEVTYLSGFIKWCRQEKNLDISKFKIEKLPYIRPIPIVLSPFEAMAIINAAEPLYRTFFLCLYTLGLRFSEARNIRAADLDFGNGSVRICQKGGSYKILPLNDLVIEAIKSLGPVKPEQYIFGRGKDKKEPLHDVRKALERARKRVGVEKKVTPHLFRHSIATHFLGENINLRTIQQYLGYAQIGTTEFYTHVALGHLKKASDKLFKHAST